MKRGFLQELRSGSGPQVTWHQGVEVGCELVSEPHLDPPRDLLTQL